MLRRTGYILGLLFVAACVGAYRLTMRTEHVVSYGTEDHQVAAVVGSGRVKLAFRLQPFDYGGFFATTYDCRVEPNLITLPMVQTFFRGVRISVPLWMLALSALLFMAWRWRRARHRQSTGFPVHQQTTNLTKRST